eukprot:8519868-Alexandrium_andersonii.AAC.1
MRALRPLDDFMCRGAPSWSIVANIAPLSSRWESPAPRRTLAKRCRVCGSNHAMGAAHRPAGQ